MNWIYGIYVSWDWGVLCPFYCLRWWYPQLLVHCIGISADPIQWRLIVCHNEKGNGKQGNMDVSLMDKILCTSSGVCAQAGIITIFVLQSLLGFPDGCWIFDDPLLVRSKCSVEILLADLGCWVEWLHDYAVTIALNSLTHGPKKRLQSGEDPHTPSHFHCPHAVADYMSACGPWFIGRVVAGSS